MFDKSKLNLAIEEFDYAKVKAVMKALNWKWADKEPTIKEMKENVLFLVNRNLDYLYEHRYEMMSECRSGGFVVKVYRDSTNSKILYGTIYFSITDKDFEM